VLRTALTLTTEVEAAESALEEAEARVRAAREPAEELAQARAEADAAARAARTRVEGRTRAAEEALAAARAQGVTLPAPSGSAGPSSAPREAARASSSRKGRAPRART
jgi:hypothetical protein